MVATQFQNLSESDNTAAIIYFALGTIFIILWFVDRYLRNGSAMGQGLTIWLPCLSCQVRPNRGGKGIRYLGPSREHGQLW